MGISISHFDLPRDSTAEDESHEETRYAELPEVLHTHDMSYFDWAKIFWQRVGGGKTRLKGSLANSLFFHRLLASPKSGTATVLLYVPIYFLRSIAIQQFLCRDQQWPFYLVVERCENVQEDDRLRKYRPRNDFCISHSNLPRLLVEVNSTSSISDPEDHTRMLLMGAFVVRFANKFVSAFQEKKDFVLCAIYIGDQGEVTRNILFEQCGKVCCAFSSRTQTRRLSSHRYTTRQRYLR